MRKHMVSRTVISNDKIVPQNVSPSERSFFVIDTTAMAYSKLIPAEILNMTYESFLFNHGEETIGASMAVTDHKIVFDFNFAFPFPIELIFAWLFGMTFHTDSQVDG